MATGCLSVPQVPQIEGRESFAGPSYYTGWWPHEGVDFDGQRVGVIGTGSSAIQSIPQIARQAEHLYVFQRTPNYSVPAHNGPPDPDYERSVKENYAEFRQKARESRSGFVTAPSPYQEISALEVTEEERRQQYEWRWSIGGFRFHRSLSRIYYAARKRTRQPPNLCGNVFARSSAIPKLPRSSCRETTQSARSGSAWTPTTTRPITAITSPWSISAAHLSRRSRLRDCVRAKTSYEFDTLVFATGFDAMTGALLAIDIRGRGGLSLRDEWAAGPRTYLGISMAGFPNLFTITGPGSPSVLSNMMVSIEQHVEWVTDCIEYMEERQIAGDRSAARGPG